MDWEDLFDEEVVDRGYGYYIARRVKSFKMTNKLITAQVVGTHVYDIEIHLNNNHIEDVECDCYYGEKCKHIAAVLHYLDVYYVGMTTYVSQVSHYKRKIDQCYSFYNTKNIDGGIKEAIKKEKVQLSLSLCYFILFLH